jgi:hypothetical protein
VPGLEDQSGEHVGAEADTCHQRQDPSHMDAKGPAASPGRDR